MAKIIFKPQKKLGQNFLFNNEYLKKIVNACQINDKSKIIEIGPGYGSLSKLLGACSSNSVISIEKDKKLFDWLIDNMTGHNVNFVLNDATTINWNEFLKNNNLFGKGDEVIVVGNLPYNISNEVILKLINFRKLFKRFVFLVQKEVAQRWVANPNYFKHKYSNFSILVNYFCKSFFLFEVPKKLFYPVPKVDGALVVLEIKDNFPGDLNEQLFLNFTKNCFRFRRKTLSNNLKSLWMKNDKIEEIFDSLNLSRTIRPQDLSIENYLTLFNKIYDK